MKHGLLIVAVLLANPAYALSVTNLDVVAHEVELRTTGTPEKRTIQPGATEDFTGASSGFLSLVSAAHKKPATSPVNSDGLLSGIVGNGRNQEIPANDDEEFVIWKDGSIVLQRRKSRSPQLGR